MKEMNSIWDKPAIHGEILKKIWKHLDLGVLERKHPFHTPVFATVADNEANPRIVVLRRFWRKPRMLAFHTHLGSPKVAEIQANPQVSWLFYSFEEKLQLRIKGISKIHTDDDLANEQWLATNFFSRRCYIGEASSKIVPKATPGLPEYLIDREPTKEESEIGRHNFTVISSTIESIDCLELAFKGHRRSLFTWNENGELESKWLTP
jgi:pyridoxamine 5'-phosphate oxidase